MHALRAANAPDEGALWPCASSGARRPYLASIMIQEICRGLGFYGGQHSQRFRVIVRGLPQHEATMSRRALLGGFALFASVLALSGCADVDAAGARFDASSLSSDPTLLITTTRKPVNDGRAKPWFGPERASTMTVARAKLVDQDVASAAGLREKIADISRHPLDCIQTPIGQVRPQRARNGCRPSRTSD